MTAPVLAVQAEPCTRERSSLPELLAKPDLDRWPARTRESFTVFSRTFGLIVSCELWSEVARVEGMSHSIRLAVASLFSVCAAAIWFGRNARPAAAVAAILLIARLACFFPLSANHYYLEILYALFLTVPRSLPEEEDLVLKAVRSTVVLGLIASGLQKVFHGYYFGGEFLCFMMAHDPRFEVLRPLVPAQEFLRLQALERGIGAGPYRVESAPLIVVSNLTYILEILVPVGLLVPWSRRIALVGAIAFVVAIEIAARELFFGALMINSLLVFGPSAIHRRALPWFAAFCLFLLAVSLAFPQWRFT
jgi:hypothetical protein